MDHRSEIHVIYRSRDRRTAVLNGGRISRSVEDLGEGTRFGLASRADPDPTRIAEVPRVSVNNSRISDP